MRLFVIILFIKFFPLSVSGQTIGIEIQEGRIDTVANVFGTTPINLCQGRCYQFYYLYLNNRDPNRIYYEDSIYWRFDSGNPSTSREHNPLVCFEELSGPDTIHLRQLIYSTKFGIFEFAGGGHPRLFVIKCPPSAEFEPDRSTVCVGDVIQFADSSIMAPDQWIWNFEGGEPSIWSGKDPPPVRYDSPGTYAASLRVANEAGQDSILKTNYIEVKEGPVPLPFWDDEFSVTFGDEVRLEACAIGDTYQWIPSEGLSCSDCPNPILTAGHVSDYRVIVGLEGFDCTDSCHYRIQTMPVEENIWFPQAFSPNKDGINDYFEGYGPFVQVLELKIFDRWGGELFVSTDDPRWDGSSRGLDMQPGSYVYYAIYKKLYSEDTDIIYGEVMLKR